MKVLYSGSSVFHEVGAAMMVLHRINVAHFEEVEVGEIRFLSEDVSLGEICSEVEKKAHPNGSLEIVIDSGLSGREVRSYYHSKANANVVIWSVANAFSCKVSFGGGGKVRIYE